MKLRGKNKARARREARRAKEQMRSGVPSRRVSADDVMSTLGRLISVNENKGAI